MRTGVYPSLLGYKERYNNESFSHIVIREKMPDVLVLRLVRYHELASVLKLIIFFEIFGHVHTTSRITIMCSLALQLDEPSSSLFLLPQYQKMTTRIKAIWSNNGVTSLATSQNMRKKALLQDFVYSHITSESRFKSQREHPFCVIKIKISVRSLLPQHSTQ